MILDEIIKSCEYVANNSKSVKINETKLDKFLETIKMVETRLWLSFFHAQRDTLNKKKNDF